MAWQKRQGMSMLCPHRYCGRVSEVDPAELKSLGIRAVLLDLDNTLVPWQGHDVPEDVLDWLERLRAAGLRLYLVSNTRFGRRLRQLSERLQIPCVRRAWKPRRRGFRNALAALSVAPEHTAMVGDQMFTDVLGGNRLGLYTIMVRPMARREFVGTKVSRFVERRLLRRFVREGLLPEVVLSVLAVPPA